MSIINLKELTKSIPGLLNKLTYEDAGEFLSAKSLPIDKNIKTSQFTPPKKQMTFKEENEEKNVKLSNTAVVGIDKASSSVKQTKIIPVSTLQEESKKKSFMLSKDISKIKPSKSDTIAQHFIGKLLKPKDWQISKAEYFDFTKEEIAELANQFKQIVSQEPMILKVKAPIKVFGDIHGQYQDLMRFFDLWGSPSEEGDIESYDYLFLGDYVDRGSHSLETICLLMALKVKYPKQIHMIRGNHEDRWINNAFGFADECSTRIGEDPNDPKSMFAQINDVFDWLPLSALIDNKIICLHGGIGSTVQTLAQISKIPRPLEVIHEVSNDAQQLVVDILWSDPTENDTEKGIQANTIRDPNGTGNIVKFGPDKVQEFLKKNQLTMILRGHECVMDGFERFAAGSLITVFSATDYCGRHKNAGAVIFITKLCELIPKLIYPLTNAEQNWAQDENQQKRPPTPPRWVGHGTGNNESYD
jgi:diadenosine tetraphosphatase ApaH/serine/threonine PP2A family protein phosphatase